MYRTDDTAWLGEAVLGWLHVDSCPRLVVGEKFDIHWLNPAAEDLLSRQLGLEARGGVLTAVDGPAQTKLKSLLQDSRDRPASICIRQSHHGGGWLVLRSVAIERGGLQVFCIAIGQAGDGSVWTFDHLAESFGLTQTEHRVVQDLLSGSEAEVLSAKHGVSVETTRTHIKSIYAKVGVKTREGLFARLQGFRA